MDITKKLIIFLLTMTCVCWVMKPTPSSCNQFTIFQGALPPFNYKSDNGQNTGISVDILTAIMKKSGNPINPAEIKYIPLARALKYTAQKDNTILFSVARTPKREHLFKWVGPIYSLKLGLISKKDKNIIIKDKKELSKFKIAAIRESAPQSILINKYNVSKNNITLVTKNSQQFKMLNAGRVDLITQSNTGAPALIRKTGLDPSEFEMTFVMLDLDLYFCFSKNVSDSFINDLQQALDEIKRKKTDGKSELDAILTKYMVDGSISICQ